MRLALGGLIAAGVVTAAATGSPPKRLAVLTDSATRARVHGSNELFSLHAGDHTTEDSAAWT